METITFDQYFDDVERLKERLNYLERQLQGLEETIKDKDKYIKKLERKLKKKDAYIEKVERLCENNNNRAYTAEMKSFDNFTKYKNALLFIENYIKEN